MHRHDRHILIALVLLLVAVPLVASPGAPHLGVEIGEPAVKILEGPDDDSDLTVRISVRVKNTTERELAVDLIVQGLDREGSELYDLHLNDAVKPGLERTFTDTNYIKERVFKSVTTWRVEEATIRGGQPNNTLQRSHSRRIARALA